MPPAWPGSPAADRRASAPRPARSGGVPVALASVTGDGARPRSTGLAELDRVLGGGLVPSSVTLMAGEPGIGKSTLLLQLLAGMAGSGRRCLLVSAEESPAQVGRRAARLALDCDDVFVLGETDLGTIRGAMVDLAPDVVVIDSIQTIADHGGGATAGTVASVRSGAAALAEDAKAEGGPAVVLVGHVTKDGSIAGPRVLEHLVDTVLSFEGERHHSLRLLRAVKHRFGPVGELGMWEMTTAGMVEVPDGTALLLADRRPGSPGSVVFAGMEGRRPLLTEVQALVGPADGVPRRSTAGYEAARLAQLLAVLHRWAGLDLRQKDVYVSGVGGVRLGDPGADLAVAAAVASAATGRPVPADMVVVGEVGLGGELRQAPHMARRLAEADRLGFGRALVPAGAGGAPAPGAAPASGAGGVAPTGLRVIGSAAVADALDVVLAAAPAGRPRLRVLGGVVTGSG